MQCTGGRRMLCAVQAAEEMLQESGLEELEARVLGFLCTNSGSLKLLSTLDDAQRLLHQVPDPIHPASCCRGRPRSHRVQIVVIRAMQQALLTNPFWCWTTAHIDMQKHWLASRVLSNERASRCTTWRRPAMRRCSRT